MTGGSREQSLFVMLGLPSRALWHRQHAAQLEMSRARHSLHSPSNLPAPLPTFFFSVTILQSLLKFKKDLKSGTPVVAGHDPVVCATVAIELGTAARSKAREALRKSWSLLEAPQPQRVAVGWLIFAERQFC